MADTLRGRGTGITIKYGKGYEETWATFTGTNEEVREDLLSYFGISADVTKDLTTSELVVKATEVAHGKGNAAAILGAMPVSKPAAEAVAADETKSDPWAAAEGGSPAPAKDEPNPLLAMIEACTSVKDIKELYARNQAAFADVTVKAAWNAKGKALQTAEKAAA